MRCATLIAIVLTGAMLSDCATYQPAPSAAAQLPPGESILAPNVVYRVPAPSALFAAATVDQMIVAHFRGQTFSFQARIVASPKRVEFVALDGFGRRALTFSWDGTVLQAAAADWLPPFLRASDVLAAISLAYWPDSAVRNSAEASGSTLITRATSREVQYRGKTIVSIDYGAGTDWSRSAHLINSALGFDVEIASALVP
jgi:hypothetical protein